MKIVETVFLCIQVNMKKVNMDVMQRWITQRITSLLGFEDDIVVGTCVNYLSEEVRMRNTRPE